MKAKTKVFSAVLICAVLAGCASGARVHETVPLQTEMPETVPPTELWTAPEIPELTQIPVVTAMPTEAAASFEVTIDPVITTQQKQVTVTTADEFLAAIAPDTEIILKDGTYLLNTAKDYGTGWSDYYHWAEEFDGPELVIYGVDNLVIRSESGDAKKCTVSAIPRYADVLTFKGCSNITVSGFTAGHTTEPGYCTGGVLYFEDCDNIGVNRCGLYGCGILGVRAELCSTVAVTGCEIYECSYGGIQMGNVSGIRIEGCSFRDLGGDALYFYDCRDVQVDGTPVSGNSRLSY